MAKGAENQESCTGGGQGGMELTEINAKEVSFPQSLPDLNPQFLKLIYNYGG